MIEINIIKLVIKINIIKQIIEVDRELFLQEKYSDLLQALRVLLSHDAYLRLAVD